MTKLKMHTPDLVAENVAKIAELFPACVTEAKDEKTGKISRKVDFDQLRQELSDHIVDGPRERYHLDWPGKREALLAANAPIAKTLRPCREESVDFDTTKNLFIEGDNLDALKLLQETYLGQVKVIAIDPPYNTGRDFIFRDNFAQNTEEYAQRSMQVDELGNKLVLNSESNGRFHSDWLTMMYPRIRLAWNLLADDGIMAITIDDAEVFQLGRIMDEVFGSSSRLACAPWLSEASGGKEKTGLRTGHEYVLIYYKRSADSISQQERSAGALNLRDGEGAYRKGRELMKWGGTSLRSDRPNQFYELTTPSGQKVLPYRNDGKQGHWRWGKENPNIRLALQDPGIFHWESRPFDEGVQVDGRSERWVPYEKIRDEKKAVGWSTWLDKFGANADATRELKELFGEKPFDTPKPVSLLKWLISLHADDNALVLDFFAGSASTAQAVIELNLEDGGGRRFVMIQVAEPNTSSGSSATPNYVTIPSIGRERLRRLGEKLINEGSTSALSLDMGFRSLKVDTSNLLSLNERPQDLKQADLMGQVSNLMEGRSEEDLLFQVLVDWGVDLTLPIDRWTIGDSGVFSIDRDGLLACFEQNISEDVIRELAKRKPLRVVFRDGSYASDSAKINAEQLFKLLSPATEVRTL
jgi:adenine-specific DNA-methyltransferase